MTYCCTRRWDPRKVLWGWWTSSSDTIRVPGLLVLVAAPVSTLSPALPWRCRQRATALEVMGPSASDGVVTPSTWYKRRTSPVVIFQPLCPQTSKSGCNFQIQAGSSYPPTRDKTARSRSTFQISVEQTSFPEPSTAFESLYHLCIF